MLINILYIHARNRLDEAARQNENGMLQCTMISVMVGSRSNVPSTSRGSPDQPIRNISTIRRHYVRTPRTENLRSIGEVCLVQQQIFPKSPRNFLTLHGDIAKSYKKRLKTDVTIEGGCITSLTCRPPRHLSE